MLLAEDGKVGLDDPIGSYVNDLPAAWLNVRIRHLLTQTSGIPSYTDSADLVHLLRSDYTPANILAMVEDLPLKFRPGTNWSYSNTNYYLLGQIIEKTANRTY